MSAPDRLVGVVTDLETCTGLLSKSRACREVERIGRPRGRARDDATHTGQGRAGEERMGHVVGSVSQVNKLDVGKLRETFFEGEEIGQGLSRMMEIRKPVPDGNPGVAREFLNGFLSKPTEHNAIEHARQNSGRIGHGLLGAQMYVRGVQAFRMAALILARHHEGASRARARLFKEQRDVATVQELPPHSVVTSFFEFGRKREKFTKSLGCEFEKREQAVRMRCGHGESPCECS